MTKISWLLLVCALALSGVAAYYSIIGLATIFSSAFWPVVTMAAILEVSKLVLASWLYHNWPQTPRLLKTYLTSAVVVLMMITSLGIFGFLSKAHVDQNLITSEAQLRLEQINTEIQNVDSIRARYENQLQQLDRSINIQLDANRAQGALAARRQQQAERAQIRERLDQEMAKLAQLNLERTRLRQQVNVVESEVGPIRYVAQFFSGGEQVDLESAVRWMIVVIVLVFDPLAVLMIIAANMSLGRGRPVMISEPESSANAMAPEPQLGQTHWDNQANCLVVYTDQGWQPIQMPMNSGEQITPEQITTAVEQVLDQWLQRSLSMVSTVDPNIIRDTVETTVKQAVEQLMQKSAVPGAEPNHIGVDKRR